MDGRGEMLNFNEKSNMMEKYIPVLDPEQIPYRFGEAWNRYDPDGIADLSYDDADFVNVTGKWWDKKTDIRKAHDFGLRVIFQHSRLEVLKVKVKMPVENIAIVHARIRILGQTENKGEKAGERRTMFLFVARKEKGEWLVVSAQNTDITGEQTNIRDEKGGLKSVSYKERKVRITRDLNEEE